MGWKKIAKLALDDVERLHEERKALSATIDALQTERDNAFAERRVGEPLRKRLLELTHEITNPAVTLLGRLELLAEAAKTAQKREGKLNDVVAKAIQELEHHEKQLGINPTVGTPLYRRIDAVIDTYMGKAQETANRRNKGRERLCEELRKHVPNAILSSNDGMLDAIKQLAADADKNANQSFASEGEFRSLKAHYQQLESVWDCVRSLEKQTFGERNEALPTPERIKKLVREATRLRDIYVKDIHNHLTNEHNVGHHPDDETLPTICMRIDELAKQRDEARGMVHALAELAAKEYGRMDIGGSEMVYRIKSKIDGYANDLRENGK